MRSTSNLRDALRDREPPKTVVESIEQQVTMFLSLPLFIVFHFLDLTVFNPIDNLRSIVPPEHWGEAGDMGVEGGSTFDDDD
jgi:hypothetical protein